MSKAKQRLLKIKESLEDIEFILDEFDFKITQAVENRIKSALNL